MSAFVTDNFTAANGTNVTARSSDSGASWIQHPQYASGNVLIASNNARSDTGTPLVYANVAPASADYSVEVSLTMDNPSKYGFNFLVCGRIDPTASTHYSIQMYDSYPFFQLVRRVAGTDTVIGSSANGWSDSGTHTLKISFAGTVIKAYADGAEIISVDDSASAITAAGYAGFAPSGGMGDVGSGDHYWAADMFVADQAGGAAAAVPLLPLLGIG